MPNFQDEMLSEVEKKNPAVIKEAEDAAISKFSEAEGWQSRNLTSLACRDFDQRKEKAENVERDFPLSLFF